MFSFQTRFRNPLPEVVGHKDYHLKAKLYRMIDDILKRSKLDELFVEFALKNRDRLHKEALAQELNFTLEELEELELRVDDFARPRFIEHSLVAFRCNIIRFLEGNYSARNLSNQMAESHLVQWFCQVETFGVINPPSKSTVDRYFRWIPEEDLGQLIASLIQLTAVKPEGQGEDAVQILGLKTELELVDCWIDNACVKANIHFPVDWVLLVDGVRTLMKATSLIRGKGELRNRMPQSPEEFIREMNVLAIAMSQVRRQPESKKKRKAVLRKMKKLEQKVRRHAWAHQEILKQRWEETPWSEKQAMRIVERIEHVIDQLPKAVAQAHERIIGERQVKSSDKMLSLYEEDINVIVRGKAGAEVEFGNLISLGEQADGLIVSWELYQNNVSDSKTSIPSLIKAQAVTGDRIKAVYGDRGMGSAANTEALEKMGVADNLGPRNIQDFRERMQEEDFAKGQKRRAQTEGRISILKNRFLGRPLRMKGFENRRQALSWAVLSHNLWVLARIRIKQDAERLEKEARKALQKAA
jgi:hypothetical protein